MPVYNHERFLPEAIEGVVGQNTNFSYRLLIGDDCSTDKSLEVIQSYQQKYPEKIFLFSRKKNVGANENVRLLFEEAHSKYYALCEGDDYWTNKFKLQKQI